MEAHPTMIPPNIRHQHSVSGHVRVRAPLTALLGQYTTLPPTSPEWAKMAHLPFHSTAAIKSQKSFRLLDRVSRRSLNTTVSSRKILNIQLEERTPHPMFVTGPPSVSVHWCALLGVSGTYSPNQSEKWIFRSAPAFSLTGRSKDLKSNQSPGDFWVNLICSDDTMKNEYFEPNTTK